MEKTLHDTRFLVRISCEKTSTWVKAHPDEKDDDITTRWIERFVTEAQGQFNLQLHQKPTQGEAVISVPFADRENVRIAFNIFASQADEEDGEGLYFHMESAF